MRMNVDWAPALVLKDGAKESRIYTCNLLDIPQTPGVYVFGRTHGESFEALYVGKATVLQQRIKQQLNNLALMMHVKNAMRGDRVLVLGEWDKRGNEDTEKCLIIIERALIRHYLERDDDIVNKHGTRLKTHEICSVGSSARHGIPSKLVVDDD